MPAYQRCPLSPLRTALRALAITLYSLALIGCAEDVGPPVAAGFDSAETELAEYLKDLHRSALDLADSGRMRGRLGMAYDANGFGDAAATTYAHAQALEPQEFLWPYLHAFAVAAGGDLQQAVQMMDEAIAIDAAYPPAWLQRATWLLDLDRLADAVAAFERALELDPTDEMALVAKAGLARVLVRAGPRGRRDRHAGAVARSL